MQTADLRMNVAMAIVVVARAIVISLVGFDIVTTLVDGPVLPMAIPPRFLVLADHVPLGGAGAGAMPIVGEVVRRLVVSARKQMPVEIPEAVVTGAVVVRRAGRLAEGARFPAVAGRKLVRTAVVRGRSPAILRRVVRRRAGRRRADRAMAVAEHVRALIITGRLGGRVMPAIFRERGAMPAWGVRPKPAMAG